MTAPNPNTPTINTAAILAALNGVGKSEETFKLPVGRTRVRLLPGWRTNGDAIFWHDFGQHFVKDAAGKVKAVVVCLDKTFGKPCKACDEISGAILRSTDDIQKARLEDMKSGSRVLFNVWLPEGSNPTRAVILEAPPSVWYGKKGVGGILQLMKQYPAMIDPVTGFDIIIERAGSGKNGTSYSVTPHMGTNLPVPAEVLNSRKDIDAFVNQLTSDRLNRALTGIAAISGVLPSPATVSTAGAGSDHPGTVIENPFQPLAQPAPAQVQPAATVAPAYVAPQQPVYAPGNSLAPAQTQPAQPVYQQSQPAPAAVAQPTQPAAPVQPAPAIQSTGDKELDELLGNLSIPGQA